MTPKNSSRNVEAASNFALSNTVNKLGKVVRQPTIVVIVFFETGCWDHREMD
jgi:hypothetical protein